jgi:hypothetical protein
MSYQEARVGGPVSTGVSPQPGWYRDPAGPSSERWWDGRTWTGATRPVAWGPTSSPTWGAQRAPSTRPDALTAALLPVGRSSWAVLSGYLGLFSILLVFAPFAIATGALALSDIGRHPEKLGRGRAVFGIVTGGLGTLALLAIFVTA